MVKQGRFFIGFILCLVCNSLFAQNPYALHLDLSKGLPANSVYNILQDKRGFIWMTCDKGLFRYDGFEYKPYLQPNGLAKPGSYLREDNNGRIWYANFDGDVFFVENDTLRKFKADLFFQHEFYIFGNYLWLNNEKGVLCQYDIKTGAKLKTMDLKLVAIFQTGDVFYGKNINNEMLIFDQNGNNIKTLIDKDGITYDKIIKYRDQYYIQFLKQNKLYLGKLDGNNLPVHLYSMEHHAIVNCIRIFEDHILVGTRTGLYKYQLSGGVPENLNQENIITCITEDNNNCLWIGTINNGVFVYPLLQNQYSFPAPGSNCRLKNMNNNIVLFDGKGSLSLFDDKTGSYHRLFQVDDYNQIYDVELRTRLYENLTENPKKIYSNFRIANTSLGALNIYLGGFKRTCLIDSKYMAFSATGMAAITKINNYTTGPSNWDNVYDYFRINTSLSEKSWPGDCPLIPGKRFKSVAYDPINKMLYFLSNSGTYCFNPNSKKPDKVTLNKAELNADEILSENGQTIALLSNGKIALIKHNIASYIEKINSIGTFLNIKLINHDFILVGTHKVYRIPSEKITLNASENELETIDLSINPNEINDIAYKEGYYYISTINALIKYKYQKTNRKLNIPFYMGMLEASGFIYPKANGLEIPSGSNDIKISFSILNYLNSPLTVFYKINADQWKSLSPSDRSISFASLSPGSYSISFKINGKEYSNAASFTILKPFYLQIWFIVSMLFVTGAMVYYIYRNRLKAHQRQNRLLLEKATLEKNLRQSMLSSIKSQMNPHFLFNALNTIQSFIITEDKKNASVYLSKFSKLTRSILNMSERDTITLQEELDALLLYLELEKMRFNEINYSVIIENNIQTHKILIPSMIIQPYVENSIKHGLLHKHGDKNLLIHISKSLKELVIIIEDNGIGRNRSRLINQTKKEKHQSFASDANLKRIEILNQEKNKIGLEYEDKFDEEQNPKGTKLTIHIPLLEQP